MSADPVPTLATGLPLADARSGVEVALLDGAGRIVWVNRAWTDFGSRRGVDPSRSGVGMSYLEVCDGADDPGSGAVAAAVRRALAGELPAPQKITIPCDDPGEPRRFDVLVSSRLGEDGAVLGATVTLSPAMTLSPAVASFPVVALPAEPAVLPDPALLPDPAVPVGGPPPDAEAVLEDLWLVGLELGADSRNGSRLDDTALELLDTVLERWRGVLGRMHS